MTFLAILHGSFLLSAAFVWAAVVVDNMLAAAVLSAMASFGVARLTILRGLTANVRTARVAGNFHRSVLALFGAFASVAFAFLSEFPLYATHSLTTPIIDLPRFGITACVACAASVTATRSIFNLLTARTLALSTRDRTHAETARFEFLMTNAAFRGTRRFIFLLAARTFAIRTFKQLIVVILRARRPPLVTFTTGLLASITGRRRGWGFRFLLAAWTFAIRTRKQLFVTRFGARRPFLMTFTTGLLTSTNPRSRGWGSRVMFLLAAWTFAIRAFK